MRRTTLVIALSLVLALAFQGLVLAESVNVDVKVKVTTERGYIDWTDGLIVATGMAVAPSNASTPAQGKLLARRGAIVDAQRQLMETLGAVKVDAETNMINMMANDVVRTKVSGILSGSFVIPDSERWDDDIYEISVGINMYGLLPVIYTAKQSEFRVTAATRVAPYTGLVIDARGLGIVPQVLFDIKDTNGRLIYGAAQALYEPAVSSGLAGYTASLESARTNPRVGNNPLVIQAARAGGSFRSTIVVTVSDGDRLLDMLGDTDVFVNCKVVVVAN